MAKFVTIGERLSTTAPAVNKAFTERDPEPIIKRAKQQLDAGATYLDVNIGPAENDGEDLMKWAVQLLQSEFDNVPLALDTTNKKAIEAGISVFDANDIDVVLQGHDHTYSRSKMLYGDGQTHEKYEFSLNADGTDYDWEHATNVDTGDQITLSPEEGDTDAEAALDAFHEDNNCYTIEDVDGNTVTDPQGILYMTANSASGSKYYELLSTQQDYIAARSQNWLPSYSVITMTADSFSIDTYQITDDGKAEAIDDTFTIQKTAEK